MVGAARDFQPALRGTQHQGYGKVVLDAWPDVDIPLRGRGRLDFWPVRIGRTGREGHTDIHPDQIEWVPANALVILAWMSVAKVAGAVMVERSTFT